jgi:hypothetical protein
MCFSSELKNNTEKAMKKACGKLIYPGTVPDIVKI